MLGLEPHADETSGEFLEAGERCEDAKGEWRGDGAGVLKSAGEDAVGEDLHSLRVADGGFAVVLDSLQIVYGGAAGEEGLGEDVGGGDCVLKGDVDADAADWGHGVGGVADAEQTGGTPVLKTVHLNGEELDFVPGVDLGSAAGEEGDDALDALLEGGEAFLLDLGEGAFGDEVADLEVVVAIDEDDETAVVEVAEGVFRVGGPACDTEPENVDGDALLDERKMCGDARDGVAAVAADGERGVDFGGTVWGVGEYSGGDAVPGLEEAGGFPAHAEGEGGEAGGLRGEEVEEVPLGHERDEFCACWDVGEIGHLKALAADGGVHAGDFGVRQCEEFFEEA